MGIFDTKASGVFTTYRARIRFRDKIMGGTPKDPKIITAWMRSKTGVTDQEELRQMMLRTLEELGAEWPEGVDPKNPTYEQAVEASEKLANRQAVGFKRDENSLYIEGRYIKSMLKEATNIVFEGMPAKELEWTKKATTRKFALAYFAERVFVNPDHISLGVKEPSGVELFIGHTTGKDGPQSNLTYYEYVTRPTIACEVMVLRDFVREDDWPVLWRLAQENGLAALRSQGFGRFDIEEWEPVVEVPAAFRKPAKEKKQPVAV